MADILQLDELRQLAEEEKQQTKLKRKLKYQKRRQSPAYASDMEYQRQYKRDKANRMRANIVDGKWRERIKTEKAGRPRPNHCEVCSSAGRIVFDHCHNSGKFRGWLCDKCNSVIGYVNDDPTLLEKLAVYLRTHNG